MAAGSETSTARALNELDGTLYMYEYDLSTVIEVQYLINCLNLINDRVLQDLYSWIDQIPLTRPKKSITRDFSDGVLMAEVVKYYFPRLVELHNFPPANNVSQKKKNWHLLNWKVFKKLNFELSEDVIESLVQCRSGTVERVLLLVRTKIDRALHDHALDPHRVSHDSLNSSGGAAGAGVSRTSLPQVSGDSVSRLLYEEKVQECLAKDEALDMLQAKVRKLEHLLTLKDIRIDDLQRRCDGVRPTAASQGGRAPPAPSGESFRFGPPNLPVAVKPHHLHPALASPPQPHLAHAVPASLAPGQFPPLPPVHAALHAPAAHYGGGISYAPAQ